METFWGISGLGGVETPVNGNCNRKPWSVQKRRFGKGVSLNQVEVPWEAEIRTRSTTTRDRDLQFREVVSTGFATPTAWQRAIFRPERIF